MPGEISRRNGRLGGRHKGSKNRHTLLVEEATEYIRQRVTAELKPIMDKAIVQAKAGDTVTRKDLFDRAYGRPKESIDVTSEGQKLGYFALPPLKDEHNN